MGVYLEPQSPQNTLVENGELLMVALPLLLPLKSGALYRNRGYLPKRKPPNRVVFSFWLRSGL